MKAALIRLNPEVESEPSRADEVLHRLRAIILSARQGSLLAANEEFAAWLNGDRSMPFGPGGAHTTVRLIDFDNPQASANKWMVSTEVTFTSGRIERRFDLVLWCNGLPVVVGEAKSPVRPAYSWFDAAAQIHDDYEKNVPSFFVPNVLSFATEGKDFRFGSVGMPVGMWGPWRKEPDGSAPVPVGLAAVEEAIRGVLFPATILDFLRFFTAFATDKKHRKIKVIARFQQFQGANLMVERVLNGRIKKGLIWHFQGSGKSLLMVFAAQKLRAMARLANPTVLIVVDRIDLDTQITGTFTAADVPNLVSSDSRAELQQLLREGARKVIITTIHKFSEAPGVLDDRHNIIAMVDEAHRTQEGDLGRKMREALPNAFLFGLTGTPINKRDRNTFWAFGAEEDKGGYLSRYTYQDSIRDGATLPLHFEPRLSEITIDQEGIDDAFNELATRHDLSEAEKTALSQKAASLETLIKSQDRVQKVAADIAEHFTSKVAPNGFKGQVVVYDKAACVAYKEALDGLLGADASAVVMSIDARDPQVWKDCFALDKDAEAKLLARFNDPADPLQVIIVTAKLLTGFDAPILQAQYLDKPLRDHTLLQAITRTNRTYAEKGKTHGLVIDYLGIFDDVAQALLFDDKSVQRVITNIAELRNQLPVAIATALSFFPGVDRTVSGYEGLIQAQAALADDAAKDAFALAYSIVGQLWEALSPDPILSDHEANYRWLTDVYESVKPTDLTGRLVWHSLGAKTLGLINEHVTVEVPRTDLETIILDAQVIEDLSSGKQREVKEELERQITARIAKHINNPKFVELGQRLNALREKYSHGQQASLEFLKELFALARDTVAAEKEVAEVPREERGRAALTELFESLKDADTPVMVERVVNDVDQVVKSVRFDGWQNTSEGDRLVQQALRKTLYVKYKIRDNDVFERALGYIREYY
ncbi:type I restriction enzyme, R subunit [Geodermatophilus siccatus]|uniref:Type I restriction enzyme endonuclease subunit n=1 Tax=Geodermatophilus siccatus TaxID=1137991 RepID=A0A1G9PUC2_9ACTN|nr:type I restriction enzyme, R subunit [Geodermatophilus siccatus]